MLSLLPNFDRIAKYFYFGVYAAGATPDGLTSRRLPPPRPS